MKFPRISKIFQSYTAKDILITKILAGLLALSVFVLAIFTTIYNFKLENKPQEYSEVIISSYEGINPLFPQTNKANDDISYLIFEGLTRYNPQTFKFEENLATFEINENATIFTYTLKDDLKWADGEPITVDDVLFTYKNIIQHPQFPNQQISNYFKDIQITNTAQNQIQFTLPQPNSFFLTQTTLPILPKHKHRGIDISELSINSFDKDQLLGSGPFQLNKIEEIDNNVTRILLEPNPHWRKKLPNISQIEFFITNNDTTAFKLQSSVNTYSDINPSKTDMLDQKQYQFSEYTKSQYTALFLNTDNQLLRRLPIREAIKNATDKKTLQQNFTDKQVVSLPIFQFQNLDDIPNANLDLVHDKFTELGYELNGEGIYQNGDEQLRFTLVAPQYETNQIKQEEIKKLTNILKQNYLQVGIFIDIKLLPSQQFSDTLYNKNYDMLLLGQDLGKDFDLYPYWHSSQSGEGRYNLSNYSNPLTDALLENIRTTSNQDEQRQLIEDINQQIYQDTPAIFIYSDFHVFAFDNKVKNRNILTNYSSSPQRFFDIENWTIQ